MSAHVAETESGRESPPYSGPLRVEGYPEKVVRGLDRETELRLPPEERLDEEFCTRGVPGMVLARPPEKLNRPPREKFCPNIVNVLRRTDPRVKGIRRDGNEYDSFV